MQQNFAPGKYIARHRASGNRRRIHGAQRRIETHARLGAGAVTFGVGAALLSGAGVAHAEEDAAGTAPNGTSQTSNVGTDEHDSTAKQTADKAAMADDSDTDDADTDTDQQQSVPGENVEVDLDTDVSGDVDDGVEVAVAPGQSTCSR